MKMTDFAALAAKSPSPPKSSAISSPEIISFDQLPEYGVRFTRVHDRRLMKRGLFPAAIQVSANRIGWRLADIEHWIATWPSAASAAREDAA
jgi:hypothetical protein